MEKTLLELFLDKRKISIDSRNIESGCIFFGLKGPSFDGNIYAEEALKKGASLAVVDNSQYFREDNNYLLVEDSLKELQNLAKNYRTQIGVKVIGITGTNGKTTTKELINRVLSSQFNTFCTQGNFNNHVGVPLSLLSIPLNTQFAIIEMGANHQGEIKELCSIADPDFGLITNIGKAHLEGFGSREIILKTKLELFDFVSSKNGVCFLNGDDDMLSKNCKCNNLFSYGGSPKFNISGSLDKGSFYVRLGVSIDNISFSIKSKLFGGYNYSNILAAIAIGHYFDIDKTNIVKAIESYQPDNNRSQIVEKNGITIIMDAYNANPSSMKAAIEAFANFEAKKKFFILGEMFELGSETKKEHQNVVDNLKRFGLNEGVLVGEYFKDVSNQFITVGSINELEKVFKTKDFANTYILVKGSRKVGLEGVLKIIG